jgi:hypothetical protein
MDMTCHYPGPIFHVVVVVTVVVVVVVVGCDPIAWVVRSARHDRNRSRPIRKWNHIGTWIQEYTRVPAYDDPAATLVTRISYIYDGNEERYRFCAVMIVLYIGRPTDPDGCCCEWDDDWRNSDTHGED